MPLFLLNTYRILFLHIPKTGGTTIENWLNSYGKMSFYSPRILPSMKIAPQHLAAKELQLLLGEGNWDYAFTVVRNPYDRAESEYFYRTENDFRQINHREDFSLWLIHHLNQARNNPLHLDNHFRKQVDFIESDVEVFYYEDGLTNIASLIAEKIQIPLPKSLPKTNVSNRTNVAWSNETLDKFNQFYSSDFEYLNYQQRAPSLKTVRKRKT